MKISEAYTCILCKKHFRTAAVFRAHHLDVFASNERCLTTAELISFHIEPDDSHIWYPMADAILDPDKISAVVDRRKRDNARNRLAYTSVKRSPAPEGAMLA